MSRETPAPAAYEERIRLLEEELDRLRKRCGKYERVLYPQTHERDGILRRAREAT